jgi:lipoyl(octanoyl) transferase
MTLHVLPTRAAGAAENMATDFLLLQRYPDGTAPRFRHYEWHRPAFTFGYAQKIAFVRSQLPPDENFDLCRRPTGGGIVDHREDWTYALVIPRGHPLEELRASHSYKAVHEALAAALRAQGVTAVTKTAAPEPDDETAGVCFQRAEIYDVVHEPTGEKIAGAAQKRNKHGLLFQGSIWRPAIGTPDLDWDLFHDAFVRHLGTALSLEPETTPWPDLNAEEIDGLTEQYSSTDWLEFR